MNAPRIPRSRHALDGVGVAAVLLAAVFAATALMSCAALVAGLW